MLDVGKLRHRVTILFATGEQDSDTGEMVETWEDLATVWAAVEPYSTRERLSAASVEDETSVRMIIRYRDDILPEMRVSFRGKLFEIVGPPSPDPHSGLEWMTLMLLEIEVDEEE